MQRMGSLIPIIILVCVLLLIAVRKVGGIHLRIWQIMVAGALAVLILGQISPAAALASINIEIMLFLFGMFVIGEALLRSGYLFHLAHGIFRRARSPRRLILLVIVASGALSALLMNDTLAIIATPLMLYYSTRFGISEKVLLLALAFGITTGSVASPTGNPQNLLIALGGDVANPFITFFVSLAVPTLLCLMMAYLLLIVRYGGELRDMPLVFVREEISDTRLALLSRISLLLLGAMIGIKVLSVLLGTGPDLPLTYIALIGALPVLVGSKRRLEVVKSIDWTTLVFFAALFILMGSVWQSGIFEPLVTEAPVDFTSIPVILASGVLVSQLVSNVPFVALYLPLLTHAGSSTAQMMALAAGSTIAGNMLIMGAASNVIIIQNAEKQGATLTFREFAEVGVPLTVLQAILYWVFLAVIPW